MRDGVDHLSAMKELEWDSLEWRSARDHQLREWVGDENALRFFLDLSHFVEIYDDLVDKDKPVSARDINHALFAVLCYMPSNPFFLQHRPTLTPLIFTSINAWADANEFQSGTMSEKALAYGLKGGGVEILLSIISITRGVEYMRSISAEVRRIVMAHESFEEYLEEVKDVV
jgi:hypothetical protein